MFDRLLNYFRGQMPRETLDVVNAGQEGEGKSTFIQRCLLDLKQPGKWRARHVPVFEDDEHTPPAGFDGYPPANAAPISHSGHLLCAGGKIAIAYHDTVGEALLANAAGTNKAADSDAAPAAAKALFLTLGPQTVGQEPAPTMSRAARAGCPEVLAAMFGQVRQMLETYSDASVSVIYSRSQEYGEPPGPGPVRILNNRRQFAAFQAFCRAPGRREDVCWERFLDALGPRPGPGVPPAIRRELVARTRWLWELIGRSRNGLGHRHVNGYLVSAKPVEPAGVGAQSDAAVGVQEVFTDCFEHYLRGRRRPACRVPLLVVLLAVAAAALFAGYREHREAAIIHEAAAALEDMEPGAGVVPPELARKRGVDQPQSAPWGADPVAYAWLLGRINDRVGRAADALAAARAADLPLESRMEASRRAWTGLRDYLAALKEAGPDSDLLTAREAELLHPGHGDGALRESVTGLMRSCEAAAGLADQVKDCAVGESFDRDGARLCQQLRAVQARFGRRSYRDETNRPRALWEDVAAPWAANSVALLREARGPDYYNFLRHADAENVAALRGLGLDVNPYGAGAAAFCRAPWPTEATAALPRLGRDRVKLRLRDLSDGQEYEWDLMSEELWRSADGRRGDAVEEATSGRLKPRTAFLDAASFLVLEVRAAPTEDGAYERVRLACRGVSEPTWLPALATALREGDAILEVDAGLRQMLREAMSRLVPFDPYRVPPARAAARL